MKTQTKTAPSTPQQLPPQLPPPPPPVTTPTEKPTTTTANQLNRPITTKGGGFRFSHLYGLTLPFCLPPPPLPLPLPLPLAPPFWNRVSFSFFSPFLFPLCFSLCPAFGVSFRFGEWRSPARKGTSGRGGKRECVAREGRGGRGGILKRAFADFAVLRRPFFSGEPDLRAI